MHAPFVMGMHQELSSVFIHPQKQRPPQASGRPKLLRGDFDFGKFLRTSSGGRLRLRAQGTVASPTPVAGLSRVTPDAGWIL